MLFVKFYLYFWILTIKSKSIMGSDVSMELTKNNNSNCINYKGKRPHIWSLSTTLAEYLTDSRAISVQSSDASQSVNIFSSKQFNCSFDEPIHWVFNLDPSKTDMKTEVDFSERIITRVKGDYKYTTNFRLLYYPKDLSEGFLFSCEPVSISDECQRNFVQAKDEEADFENDPTPLPHESLTFLSNALLKSSKGSVSRKYFNEISCPLRLFLKVEYGNSIRFRWETQNGTRKGIVKRTLRTNETTSFQNSFRLRRTHEPSCVRILNETEDCLNCKDVEEDRNSTTNAAVFYAHLKDAGDVYLLYKGLFSLPYNSRSERIFFLEHQISDSIMYTHMMQLIIPEKVYANVSFRVQCRVSSLFFSYGTIITDKQLPDTEVAKPKEHYKPFGYREVEQIMKFQEIGQVKSVSCFSPLKTSDRWISKSKPFLVHDGTVPSIDSFFENITIFQTVPEGAEFIIIKCNASGNPSPSLRWIPPLKFPLNETHKYNITRERNYIAIVFLKWEEIFSGTYICEATNFLGVTTKTVTFLHESLGSKSNVAVIVSSSLGGLVLLLGLLIGILAWNIRKQRLEFEKQTQKAVEEFKNGIKSENISQVDVQDPNFSIHQLPYNEKFEIPQDKWEIENKILGTGQFGIVRMGSVMLKGVKVSVAIKSLKSSVEIDEFKSFLFELKIMAYLGQHKNIVSLIAACTEGINNRDIFIGVEFCDNGSLLDYLRKHRGSFLNMVGKDGKLISDLSLVMNESHDYTNLSVICTHQLYRWAYHVACGMDYLKLKKVLHGDLAARNVLLTTRKVAKVGDFGLSRVLMNSENYTKQTQTALPWKWMAIESLANREFSFYSDVWSYGILLYEIFTLGQTPYPGIGWSPDFLTQLQNGMRMEQPVNSTTSIYKMMRSTWEHDPNHRPSYVKIKRKLSIGLQRLSALINSNKDQQQQQQPPALPTESTDRQAHNSSTNITQLEIDDAGMYRNLPRRTMNYYKNC